MSYHRRLDFSVPQNVRIRAINPHIVILSWKPPAGPNGRITSYTVEWFVDKRRQKNILINSGHFYAFKGLKSGQTVEASVCAHNQPATSVKLDYIGSRSDFVKITTPSDKRAKGSVAIRVVKKKKPPAAASEKKTKDGAGFTLKRKKTKVVVSAISGSKAGGSPTTSSD
ncbi:unnamed protein product [Hydatigera taeniaeformis]|uniref:Fibronectin type-III domain-containing protein n=1 Tax=Hydatigena taeniaeformis TaxID=6205 RepID=A0A0R3WVM3_HYDTA|nr:unnamed protein product [Hydatigera taeniaeformis]